MYRMCSCYLCFRYLLVCPMYDSLHVLQVSLYIPLLLCSCVWFFGSVFVGCCIVFLLLKVIPMSACLKQLVNFIILGLWYVKTVHFLFLFFLFASLSCVRCVFCCICDFSFVMTLSGKLSLCAMAFILFHCSFPFCS